MIWIARDDDGRLWIHPYSKPVLHTYTDFMGFEHKRWVTESQTEINPNLHQEVTFENSPRKIIIE